jgi:hypothetical protein
VNVSNAIVAIAPGIAEHVISVEAVNETGHAVRVTGFGIEANDGSNQNLFFVWPVAGSTLPGSIAPHDAGNGLQLRDKLADAPVDLKKPVVAFVNLANGERFRSKPTRLAA